MALTKSWIMISPASWERKTNINFRGMGQGYGFISIARYNTEIQILL